MIDVLVIGGGIIGTSVAAAVAARGASVVLLEAGPPTEGSSSGNAGHLVPSHVIPFAAPGMVGAGVRSLAARDGAFAVDPHAGSAVAGWLTRFARAATTGNVERAAPVLSALLNRSLETIRDLAASGAELDLDTSGLLQVFTSERSWSAGRHEAETLRALGYPARDLTVDEVVAREPLVRGAVGGILLERDGRLDPALLLSALRERAHRHGAQVRNGAAVGLSARSGGGASVSTTAGTLHAEQVVIAAGVWTRDAGPSRGRAHPADRSGEGLQHHRHRAGRAAPRPDAAGRRAAGGHAPAQGTAHHGTLRADPADGPRHPRAAHRDPRRARSTSAGPPCRRPREARPGRDCGRPPRTDCR